MNQNTPATPAKPQHPEIAIKPVKSSQIHGYGYDAASRTLAVQFHKKGKDATGTAVNVPGALYHYHDVSPEAFAGLEAAESKYSHFHAGKSTAFSRFTRIN